MAAEEVRDGDLPAAAPPIFTNRDPVQIGFWRAFATQSNLSSEMTRETWHGHHFACRRILAWILLSTVSATLGGVLELMTDIPVLKPMMSQDELLKHRDLLTACQQAVCEAAREFSDLECVVDRRGSTSAFIDYANYKGPKEQVPLPDVCYTFAETFGFDLLGGPSQDPAVQAVALLGFSQNRRRSKDKKNDELRALFEITPDCSLLATIVEDLEKHLHQPGGAFIQPTAQKWTIPPIYPLVEHAEASAGERIKKANVTKFFCPPEMPPQEADLITAAYDLVFGHRHLWLGFVLACSSFGLHAANTFTTGVSLLLVTLVYRFALPWPRRQDMVGFQRVSFFSTWKTLLLLCTVSSQHPGNLGDAIQISILCFICVYCYSDHKAARAWLDLAVVWFGAPYLYPLLDQVSEFVAKIDALYIFRFIGSWIAAFTVGKGWWKLVTLFVVYRAHPLRVELSERYFRFGARGRENAVRTDAAPAAATDNKIKIE